MPLEHTRRHEIAFRFLTLPPPPGPRCTAHRIAGTPKFIRFGVNLHYSRLQLGVTEESVKEVLLQLPGGRGRMVEMRS